MNRSDEIMHVIPRAAWITAFAIAFLVFGIGTVVMRETGAPPFAVAAAPVAGAVLLACYILMVGYIHGDARRRGMRYVMWTLLALFIPNGIGFILYFVLRDPMPVPCWQCGASVAPDHAFCPRCGAALHRACSQCHHVAGREWNNCAFCGAPLVPTAGSPHVPA